MRQAVDRALRCNPLFVKGVVMDNQESKPRAFVGICDGLEYESLAVLYSRPGVVDKIKEIHSRVALNREPSDSRGIDSDQ
jgi:hypothetical protein